MKAELIDFMGSDITVVNSARVSFDKTSDWEYLNKDGEVILPKPHWEEDWDIGVDALLPIRDQKLINYLAKNSHFTPFTHVQITMRETVPIFVARQRFKHQVGFTYNEVSRRYVSDEPTFFVPDVWRKAAENKKQGSSDETVNTLFINTSGYNDITKEYKWFLSQAEALYNAMIKGGVAPEQARMVLPQSMYTSYYTTGSLAAWARAYNLRSEENSQKEIQDLAEQWHQIIGSIPELTHSWRALTNKKD